MVNSPERDIMETRKLFGLMFQDGALFGSMSLFDNIAFPLREHTRKKESEIRRIVMERIDIVGLLGAEESCRGDIRRHAQAGRPRPRPRPGPPDHPLRRAGLGLDPVRTAYLSQLLIDLNAQIDATMLIVTHNLDIAATVPDNMGMLFCRNLVTFGPREVLLTSDTPVVSQFLAGRREGPIGMSEEKDAATLAAEQQADTAPLPTGPRTVVPQLEPSPGMPVRQGALRRRERVMSMMGQLPEAARTAILDSYAPAAGVRARDRPDAGAATRAAREAPAGLLREGPREGPRPAQALPAARPLRETGKLFALAVAVARAIFRRPFQVREFIEQFWFVASVTILPAALVSIPFGAVIALQVGSLTQQLGAQSFTGGASVSR